MDRSGNPEVCFRTIEYQPLPSQRSFHECEARFKGFSGPIGSGKSQAACQEAIRLSYQNPGRLGLIGAPTYPMLRDATQSTLFDILENNRVPYEYSKAENVLTMKDTRSRVLFRPVDDFERLRGTNLAWFGLDELTYCPEAAWMRLEGRLRDPKATRLCGFAVWTPKGFDWVYQKFLAEPVEGYEVVVAPPFENRFLLSKVPDFYQRLRRSYDETFYQQEVLGEYLNLSGGLVYSAFRRDANVRALQADPAVPLYWTLDFNVDPMSSLVAQAVGGRLHVLSEIVLRHASTQEACEEFVRRFRYHPKEIVVFGDASGNARQTTGNSDFEIVREQFRSRGLRGSFRIPDKNPDVRPRVQLTNAMLRSAAGEVRLLVDPGCKELIKDLEQVSYKADSNQIDKERDRRRTHLSDALGYLLWELFRSRKTIGERSDGPVV